MTFQIIVQIILLGVALSMDAFAVSIANGLIYQDINKKKALFIALVFGLMQGLMPLIGYWLVELVEFLVNGAGANAGNIMSAVVTWVAFTLLLFIGGKMIIEGILSLRKPQEEKIARLFSYKEVLLFGVATSIDALGSGIAGSDYVTASYDASTDSTTIALVDSRITSSSVLTSTSTKLTREQDVYGAIQAATGGTTIPAQNPSVCTASTPCALVAEYNSTNSAMELHWRTMATASDNGGACGDAAGTGCNASNNPGA